MSNSLAFIGVGVAMEALQFAPGVSPSQIAWLVIMSVVTTAVGVGNALKIAWRAAAAVVVTRRVRAMREVRARVGGAGEVSAAGGAAHVV